MVERFSVSRMRDFLHLYLSSSDRGMMSRNTANRAMEVRVERTEILARLLAIFTLRGVRLVSPEVKTDLASVMNLGRTFYNTLVDCGLSQPLITVSITWYRTL